jgi:hypothetical protein
MKLLDLFEDNSITTLAPGEKRVRLDLKIRNLQAIQKKMKELRDSLYKSIDLKYQFTKDAALQAALEQLEKRIVLKLDYLEKMKSRPTTGVQKMFAILDSECSEFLKVFKETQKFLYRGLRDTVSVFEGRSREDRSPQDSTNEISERFDQALKNAGFSALRSNSIFTTTSLGFASTYGHTLYLIFPKNGFHFLYTNTKDLILNDWSLIADVNEMREFKEKLRNWLEANVEDWKNTDIGYGVENDTWQTMFWILQRNFGELGNPYKIPEEFNVNIEDFITDQGIVNSLEPKQTDLAEAMVDGREILINGEYWALKREDWIDIIGQHYIGDNYNEIISRRGKPGARQLQ